MDIRHYTRMPEVMSAMSTVFHCMLSRRKGCHYFALVCILLPAAQGIQGTRQEGLQLSGAHLMCSGLKAVTQPFLIRRQ